MKLSSKTSNQEKFQIEIRKRNRQEYKDKARKAINSYQRINHLLQLLYATNSTEQNIDQIIELSHLLQSVDVDKLPRSTIELLRPLTHHFLAQLLEETLPNHIQQKCKMILCLLTERSAIWQLDYSEKSLMVLVSEITQKYIKPDYIYYQCLCGVGNYISIDFNRNSQQNIYELLQKNQIQNILSSILAIKNDELVDESHITSPYFSQQDEQELFIWFVKRYLKFKEQIRHHCLHNCLLIHLSTYSYKTLKNISALETAEESLPLYQSLTQIVYLLYLNLKEYSTDTGEWISELIQKNAERKGTALLFQTCSAFNIITIEDNFYLLNEIIQTIALDGEHPRTSIRDKFYLDGLLFILESADPSEVVEFWEKLEGKGLQRMWERPQLQTRLMKMQKVISAFKQQLS